MTRKMNVNLRRILSVALAMMMCLSVALPGFATNEKFIEGTETQEVLAAITKRLEMPIYTKVPNFSFRFDFKPISVDGDDYDVDEPNMPPIGSQTIAFTNSDNSHKDFHADQTNGSQYIMRESASDIFNGVAWKHAGIYTYYLNEFQTTDLPEEGKGNIEEILILSKAVYKLEILVAERTLPLTGFYVKGLAVNIIKGDDGLDADGKIDARPGTPDKGDGFSEMRFINKYAKNNGEIDPEIDPEDPEDIEKYTVLDINKIVSGDFANKEKFFEFLVTANKPEVVVPAEPEYTKYRAYVMEGKANGDYENVTSADNYKGTIGTDTNGNKFIEFTSGAPLTVYLKHNQHLAFTDLYVGSSFSVTESADPQYIANYTLIINGTTGTKTTFTQENQARPIAKTFIGEEKNEAEFDNLYKYTAPTGISVDNLPYIVMIVSAMFAFAGLTVLKYRRGSKIQA